MLYAHRKFLVTATQAKEDGELLTVHGKIPVFVGNVVAHDDLGNPFVMPESYFKENYIPVKKVKDLVNLDEMAAAYMTMGELIKESNDNNEDYIFDVKKSI